MASAAGEPTSRGSSSGSSSNAGSFECNICFDMAQDPIVTLCGHLFCWPCLYKWLRVHSHSPECPVCKAVIEQEKLVPLYGRGKESSDPRAKPVPEDIPHRPAGQRPPTAPQGQFPNNAANGNANPNPWFMGGVPFANGRWGNYAFSAAIGGLFPLLSFQVHGFPDAAAYGVPGGAGFPYGGYHGHGFHGIHAGHGVAHAQRHVPPQPGQQADTYLKVLLLLIGFLVILSLVTL